MFSTAIKLLLSITENLGYLGVFGLMAVESSFIPFPSEIIIPPAAFLAAQGKMNIYLVIISGIAGSLAGAFVNYYLALSLGRKVIYKLSRTRWSKFFLIDEKKINTAEKYFLKYGRSSTFFGRLVFGVRQLISIPAGFSKMPILQFSLYTALGSCLWVVILAMLGYFFGANDALLSSVYDKIKYGSLFFMVLAVSAIILVVSYRRRATKAT